MTLFGMPLQLAMMGALLSQRSKTGRSPRREAKIRKRYDWRSGPTPKHGSRRWRAMMEYRKSIAG